MIKCHERVAYNSVNKVINDSCINLLLTNTGRKGILTTKFFEYLAVGRPLFCIPGDGGELDRRVRGSQEGCRTLPCRTGG